MDLHVPSFRYAYDELIGIQEVQVTRNYSRELQGKQLYEKYSY